MKKVPENKPFRLFAVKMYWDDLTEIYDFIKKNRYVEVKSAGYLFEDGLGELKEKTKKSYIDQVSLLGYGKGYNNRISVDIKPDEIWIHFDSESTETASKIKDILTANSPWYFRFFDDSTLLPPIGLIATPVMYLIWNSMKTSLQKSNSIILFIVIFITFIFLGFFLGKTSIGKTKVFTCFRKDNLTFLDRNKDKLIRDSIFLLIGYLLGKFI